MPDESSTDIGNPSKAGTDVGSPAKANGSRLWSTPPVLRTEAPAQFDAMCEALNREIEPRGIIEEMYVNDIACASWEISRLRRCKTALLNAVSRVAFVHFAARIYDPGRFATSETWKAAEHLAINWFDSEGAPKGIEVHGGRVIGGETIQAIIETEAIRRSFHDLGVVDKMLLALEARRDKALVVISHYRTSFARRLRENTDRIIETQTTNVPVVEDASVKAAPD
jgi:hypothetical protein